MLLPGSESTSSLIFSGFVRGAAGFLFPSLLFFAAHRFLSPDVYSSSSFVPVFYLRVVASCASSNLRGSEGIFLPDRSHFDAILIIAGSDNRYAVTHALKVNISLSKVVKDQRGLVSKLAVLAAPEGKTEQDRLIYQG